MAPRWSTVSVRRRSVHFVPHWKPHSGKCRSSGLPSHAIQGHAGVDSAIAAVIELFPFQAEALQKLRTHARVLVLAPTGSGKSRIFQQYLIENPTSRAVLISPLNALRDQHLSQLARLGITARNWSPRTRTSEPSSRVITLSPELIPHYTKQHSGFGSSHELLIFDECHTGYEWGRTFRPSLSRVLEFTEMFPWKNVLFLTASLPAADCDDLANSHGFTVCGQVSFPERLEIFVHRVAPAERARACEMLLSGQTDESALIFTRTRESAERLSFILSQFGFHAPTYHAGLDPTVLAARLQSLRRGEVRALIGTTALGMGIDLPELARVILCYVPRTPQEFLQLAGRCGRRGTAGKVFLLWDPIDFLLTTESRWIHSILNQSERVPKDLKREIELKLLRRAG